MKRTQRLTSNGYTDLYLAEENDFQGDDNWHQLRLGVLTASKIYDIKLSQITKLIFDLAWQRKTKSLCKQAFSKDIEHGNWGEKIVLDTYCSKMGTTYSTKIVFGYNDRLKLGASPDAFLGKFFDATLLEVKCPREGNALALFVAMTELITGNCGVTISTQLKTTAKKYYYQIQAQMLVLGIEKAKMLIGEEGSEDTEKAIIDVYEVDILPDLKIFEEIKEKAFFVESQIQDLLKLLK